MVVMYEVECIDLVSLEPKSELTRTFNNLPLACQYAEAKISVIGTKRVEVYWLNGNRISELTLYDTGWHITENTVC